MWLALTALAFSLAASGQDAAAGAVAAQDPATRVDDVVVQGRRLEDLVSDFVTETSAPARGRGLARWQGRICVGVVNIQPDLAQHIADRVSQVAMDLGVTPGDPGCRADVVIVFTDDGRGLATKLADEHQRAFRSGVGGLDRGRVAFADFAESDRPVRWWHVSMPVNAETGQRAIRLPGDVDAQGNPVAPVIGVFAASRLTSQIRDDMRKAMVIVDIDDIGQVNLPQLADYIAFVSLAQVDPTADFSAYDTILNLFDEGAAAPAGLTQWDISYLTTLYRVLDSPQAPSNANRAVGRITDAMTRERQDASRRGDPPPADSDR